MSLCRQQNWSTFKNVKNGTLSTSARKMNKARRSFDILLFKIRVTFKQSLREPTTSYVVLARRKATWYYQGASK